MWGKRRKYSAKIRYNFLEAVTVEEDWPYKLCWNNKCLPKASS